MSQNLKLVRFTGIQIDGKEICCTGQQLILLLRSLESFLEGCSWFVADITLTSISPTKLPISISHASEVGSTEQLIAELEKINQFLSGIFLALPKTVNSPNWPSEFFTEDEAYRTIGNALIEIRAFDTSYFEIYSESPEILQVMTKNLALFKE